MNLNLGCGTKKKSGYIGVDSVRAPCVDVLANLEHLPFKTNSIDSIYCRHVLEHVDNFNKVIEEMWRIISPWKTWGEYIGFDYHLFGGGIIEIIVPFWAHAVAHNDPDHKRRFGYFSFDNYTTRKNKTCLPHNKAKFKIINKRYWSYNKFYATLANKYPKFYENYLAGILPVHEVHFTLRKL